MVCLTHRSQAPKFKKHINIFNFLKLSTFCTLILSNSCYSMPLMLGIQERLEALWKKKNYILVTRWSVRLKKTWKLLFTGKIEKVYENSALLTITDYADQDRQNASELNFKIVANFHAMTKNLGGGTVLAFPPEAEEDRKK